MPDPDHLSVPAPDVWPKFRMDAALDWGFDLIDVNLPRVAEHLADRGVPPAVIGDHTLALTIAPENLYKEAGGHYWYEQAGIDLYPERAIGAALLQYIDEAIQADDWERPLELAQRTKTVLDCSLTHELQHVVDFTAPGAYEAAMEYNRGTDRMLRRRAYGTLAGVLSGGVMTLAALEGLYRLNPETSIACPTFTSKLLTYSTGASR